MLLKKLSAFKATITKRGIVTCVVLIFGIISLEASADDRYWQARSIAEQALAHNIVHGRDAQYLVAGGRQYRSLWIRDFAMSVGGALDIGQARAVRDTLTEVFARRRPDGLLPRCIDNLGLTIRFLSGLFGFNLPFSPPFRAWYETENKVISIDGNAMIPWAAAKYVLQTKDTEFAKQYFGAAEDSLRYLEDFYFDGGLVAKQAPFADWEDSLRRTGKVAFTNELYILSLRGLSLWAYFLGDQAKMVEYYDKAQEATKRFYDYFWMPSKRYVKNFQDDETHISADANFMAVAYGILPQQESLELLETVKSTPLWGGPMPGRATWPDYPDAMKSANVRNSDTKGYHDRMYWLWLTGMAAKAESAVGNCAGYYDVMNRLSAKIVADRQVWEAFDLRKHDKLRPFRGFGGWITLAEHPFTWNSALYLDAEAEGCDPSRRPPDI